MLPAVQQARGAGVDLYSGVHPGTRRIFLDGVRRVPVRHEEAEKAEKVHGI